jgi:hypothetical protein
VTNGYFARIGREENRTLSLATDTSCTHDSRFARATKGSHRACRMVHVMGLCGFDRCTNAKSAGRAQRIRMSRRRRGRLARHVRMSAADSREVAPRAHLSREVLIHQNDATRFRQLLDQTTNGCGLRALHRRGKRGTAQHHDAVGLQPFRNQLLDKIGHEALTLLF